jgi:hypothetical protein
MEIPDYRLFCAIKGIANRVYELLAEHDGTTIAGERKSLWLQDWRSESVNPYYSQTSQGLMLELYYGTPSRLWTPWGQWGFAGSSAATGSGFEPLVAALCEELGASVFKPEVVNSMGCFGPVYALSKFEGESLPAPAMRPRDERLTYEDAKAQWESLQAIYSTEHGAHS